MANANLIGAGAGPVVQVTWGDFDTGHVAAPVVQGARTFHNMEGVNCIQANDANGFEVFEKVGLVQQSSDVRYDVEEWESEMISQVQQEVSDRNILQEIELAKTMLLPYLRHLENFAELLDMLAKGCNTLSNRARRKNDQATVQLFTDNRDNYNRLQVMIRFEIVRVVGQIDAIDPRILEFDMYDAKREVADLFEKGLIPMNYFERKCYRTAYSRFLEDLAKGKDE